MYTDKDIHDLKLHEVVQINSCNGRGLLYIRRVEGGFMYEHPRGDNTIHPVFVPYSEPFGILQTKDKTD